MPRQPNRLARIFAPLPDAVPSVQWRLLDAAFMPLAAPPAAVYATLAGALAAFAVCGRAWCLAWALASLGCGVAARRLAVAYDMRGADKSASAWARRFARMAYGQGIVLGAGGVAAVLSGDPVVALMLAAPLSFAAAWQGASAVLAGPARAQAVLLLGPLAVAALAESTLTPGGPAFGGAFGPAFGAMAALAGVLAAMAVALAGGSAEQANAAAEAQTAAARETIAGAVPAPAPADFQRLLGRDQATGLPNKHSFLHLLAQESTRAFRAETALSLLLVSWDDYDSNRAGTRAEAMDLRIAGIARRLRGTLHRQQDIIASLGGGKFAVVLPFTDAFGAKTVAENLQAALRTPILEQDGNDATAAAAISIGAATYCGKGLLPETQLLQYAEEALAAARKTGGDKITRYDPMVATLKPPPFVVPPAVKTVEGVSTAGK